MSQLPPEAGARPPDKSLSLPRLLSFGALVAVILLLGYVFFRVMAGFLLPMFLAVLLVVIFRPMHLAILRRCGGRPRVAAALTTLAVLLTVLVPVIWTTVMAVNEAASLVSDMEVRGIRGRLETLRERLGLQMPHAEELRHIDEALDTLLETELPPPVHGEVAVIDAALERVAALRPSLGDDEHQADGLQDALERVRRARHGSVEREDAIRDARIWLSQIRARLIGGFPQRLLKEWANPSDQRLYALRDQAVGWGQRLAGPLAADTAVFLFRFAIGLVILGISLYYFLADGPALLEQLTQLSPLNEEYERELLAEFDQISRAVVLATLLSALAQGALAGIGYWVVGFEAMFLMTLATVVLALIPFVGAATLWIPACLWLLLVEERLGAAIGLAVYGALVVSMIDNIVKPVVLHGRSKLHPLLALLSVLGGVQALGAIGIFVGPMVVAFLQALLNILHRELTALGGKGGRGEAGEADDSVKAATPQGGPRKRRRKS